MKKSLLIILSFTLLSSCGQSDNEPARLKEAQIGAELSTGETLSGGSKDAALRICYAFRSKNSAFRTINGLLGSTFSFTLNYTDCSNSKRAENEALATTLAQTLQSAPLIYDSTNTHPYMKEVQTHQHGELASLCQSLIMGEDVQTVVSVNSEQKKEFRFGTSDQLDHYSISIANKTISTRGSQIFAITEEHRYFVNTTSDASNRKGVVYNYSFRKACSSDTQLEEFSQVLSN